MGQLTALDNSISGESNWQGVLEGIFGASIEATFTTQADQTFPNDIYKGDGTIIKAGDLVPAGTVIVNPGDPGPTITIPEHWTGFVDPLTGMPSKAIWDRMREIIGYGGQATISAPPTTPVGDYTAWHPDFNLNTEMGLADWFLSAYLEEQYLGGQAADLTHAWLNGPGGTPSPKKQTLMGQIMAAHPSWFPNVQAAQPEANPGLNALLAQWRQRVVNLQARIVRNRKRRDLLPEERRHLDEGITAHYKVARFDVNSGARNRLFDLSQQLRQRGGTITSAENLAVAGVRRSVPSDFKGDAGAWAQQQGFEVAMLRNSYETRRRNLEALYAKRGFGVREARSRALLALSLGEESEKSSVADDIDAQQTHFRDLIGSLTTEHTNAGQKVTDINTSIGQANSLIDTLQQYIAPNQNADTNIKTLQLITIPGLVNDASQLGISLHPPQTPGAAAGPSTDQLLQIQTQLNQQLALANAVLTAQYDVLSKLPLFAGHFAMGGIVPGPLGEPRTAIVHGGEEITPPGARGRYEAHVHIGNGMEWLRDFVGAEVKSQGRTMARTGIVNLPGAGGARLRVRA
jgi:hypothetical protein